MKYALITIFILAGLIGVGYLLGNKNTAPKITSANNVSIIDGKQIIEIRAKGGYQPSISNAKAGVPTILRFTTSGTFDCSSSIRIPSLDITKTLPQSGATDIALGTPQPGNLQGSCGMGMYPFTIAFNN